MRKINKKSLIDEFSKSNLDTLFHVSGQFSMAEELYRELIKDDEKCNIIDLENLQHFLIQHIVLMRQKFYTEKQLNGQRKKTEIMANLVLLHLTTLLNYFKPKSNWLRPK
ncbi:MAG: hypothetical protein IPH20_17985 [Bacteroidales bacterium]|nr:hypothetical protein [Bacteroidales bacterium]